MIRMPRRSVTRFFIPLIDVLILLFCIFLLMEFNSETKADEESDKAEDLAIKNDNLAGELARRLNELRKFETLRDQLNELDALRFEVERLRNAQQQDLRNRLYVRTIEYDGKDGSISFYDEARPQQPLVKITDAQKAMELIERHTNEAEAQGRMLYYQFVLPRPYRFIFPNNEQKRQYAKWFAGAANSLEVKTK
jgi:hypothetical protein